MSSKQTKTQIPYEEWMELQFSLACVTEEMYEVEEFLKLFGTADREEGMTAFLQKRPATFTGR